MTIEEAIILGSKYLPSAKVKMILAVILGKNPLELLLNLNNNISNDLVIKYKNCLTSIKNGTPIQYALGTVNFCGLILKINPNVLIPRFETEELVINTLELLKEHFPLNAKIIDLGTGSGAIGLTLKKKMPTLDVTLLDISEEALKVAKENADSLNLQVNFIKNDMLDGLNEQYDCIISNPPYIKNDEEIEPIVKKNEPHLALYGGYDGLKYYRQIINMVQKCTKTKYLIAFEIGPSLKDSIIELLNNNLSDIRIIVKEDLQGRNRMLFVCHF